MHSPTVGSQGDADSHGQGTPVFTPWHGERYRCYCQHARQVCPLNIVAHTRQIQGGLKTSQPAVWFLTQLFRSNAWGSFVRTLPRMPSANPWCTTLKQSYFFSRGSHYCKHQRTCLTQCIYQIVLESQLPHTIVKLIFELVLVNNKLTILWGS